MCKKEGEEKGSARGSVHLGSPLCVFITAVPIIKLFAWGEGDSGGHVLRENLQLLELCEVSIQ